MLVVPSVPLAGQAPDTGDAFCFLAKAAPECRSWVVLEAQGVLPLAESSDLERDPVPGYVDQPVDLYMENQVLEFNLGLMYNLTPKVSLGGFWTGGTNSGTAIDGLRARVRWWVADRVSVEGEAGMIRTNLASLTDPVEGPSVGARINLLEILTTTVRYDRVEVPARVGRTGGTVSGISAGVGFSGRAGLGASALVGVGVAAIVIILAGSLS